MRLDAFFNDVYRPLRLRGKSPRSVLLHNVAIRNFGRWLERPATLADLDDLTLARYLDARGDQVSPHTVERERNALCAQWRLACDRGLLAVRPTIQPVPLPQKIPTAWTVAQLNRLFQAARSASGTVGPVLASVWFPALLTLSWESGERIGALLAAQWADLAGGRLAIHADARKGRREPKLHHLSDGCVAQLLAARAPGRPEVLWWPMALPSLYDRLHKILDEAGLRGKRVAFHQMRRSAATHLTAAGGNAQTFLGHLEPRTTLRYIDPRILPQAAPAWSILPRLK
jgi:integrase